MFLQGKNLSISLYKVCLKNLNTIYSASLLSALFFASIWVQYAHAFDGKKVFNLTIKDHIFTPATLTIPANEKVKIIIENKDKVAEEFESFDLNREKVIFAGRKSTIYVGPLPAGTYEYFGEFHPNTARGKVIVVEQKP